MAVIFSARLSTHTNLQVIRSLLPILMPYYHNMLTDISGVQKGDHTPLSVVSTLTQTDPKLSVFYTNVTT